MTDEPDFIQSIEAEIVAAHDDAPAPAPEPVVETPPVVEETPPATETAPEVTDDIDSLELPKNSSASAAENFKKVKETAKGYKAKVEAAEQLIESIRAEYGAKETEYLTKAKDFEATAAEIAAYKAREAEFEEAQKELALSRVEGTADYKRTIREPLSAIADRAGVIAKANEVSKDLLLDAIAERDYDKQREMLDELIPGLKPVDQLYLVRMADDAREIFTRKEQIEADAVTAAKEIRERQEKESLQAKETNSKAYTSAVDHAATELGKRLPFVALKEGETADGVLAKFVKDAKETDFDAASPNTKATAALSMLLFERSLLQMQKMDSTIKALEKRITEARAAEPVVGGPGAPPTAPDNSGDVTDAVAQFFNLKSSQPASAFSGG